MIIKQGQLVAIATGEYSDYGLRDHMRALRDFDADIEASRFKAEGNYRENLEWDDELSAYGSDDRFLDWAVRERLLVPLDAGEVIELHLGSYGRLEIGSEAASSGSAATGSGVAG